MECNIKYMGKIDEFESVNDRFHAEILLWEGEEILIKDGYLSYPQQLLPKRDIHELA